ncbi:MAG: efflux RND transporter periplasmic adaptor subunit [Planctomycetota bacterium]
MKYILTWLLLTSASLSLAADPSDELECFTEPYRRVDVPAAEIGVIHSIVVNEGDTVAKGQLVAKLDDEVLRNSLEIARTAKDATGSLQAALSELKSRQRQLANYQALREKENATERELQRAETAMDLAVAKVQVVRDELEVRRMEFERTNAQLKKRQILAPLGGVVVEIEKEAGEFVSPNDPVVLSIVELSRLKAVFSVPHESVSQLKVGDTAIVRVGMNDVRADAVIQFVSPTADPQSGTVRVKLSISNGARALPCGVICRWDLNHQHRPAKLSRATMTGRAR